MVIKTEFISANALWYPPNNFTHFDSEIAQKFAESNISVSYFFLYLVQLKEFDYHEENPGSPPTAGKGHS